jgi:hypothetical protein
LKLVSDDDFIIQRVTIRLKYFINDWFLNINFGLPYFEEILVKNPNAVAISDLIKNMILTTPGVEEITEFTFDYQAAQRFLAINFKATTTSGQEITVEVEV